MDYIKQLETLAMASRLKRLSERLMRDVAQIYQEQKYDFQPRWFPVLHLLASRSPLAVTEVAETLRMTHPAINQISTAMEKRGYLVSARDKRDERRRLLKLSKKGINLCSSLRPLWMVIKEEAEHLLTESGVNLLGDLDSVEKSLDTEEMYPRIKAALRKKALDRVDIFEYKPACKRYFKSLNLEWLNKYFKPEKKDLEILNDPYGRIIKTGGRVLFAKTEGKIVGTAALIKIDNRTYELAKMAVTEPFQRRWVGHKLTEYIIKISRNLRAEEILLLTSAHMIPAVNLYRSFGFVEIANHPKLPIDRYRRKSIIMKLELNKK